MLSTQKERENFYRISTIIVDHGKESLILLLDNELNSNNQTLEDFINLNQHDIYHLCFNRYTCCQCVNRKLPLTTPTSRVLHPDQLNILLDKNGKTLSCHNIKSKAQFCCCPAKSTLTTKHLDLTFLRCLLINFASICPPNSNIRLAVDDLIGHRNKLYGHAQEAKCSGTDYILYKSQIETVILTIAKSCNKKSEMKQKLKDAEVRPLDEIICQQYQNCLLSDIRQNEEIKTEIYMIREQSRQNRDQIVQRILESKEKIANNITSQNEAFTDKIDGMMESLTQRDEILYERIKSLHVKVVDEVNIHSKEIMRTIKTEEDDVQMQHTELIGHLHKTEHNIRLNTVEQREGILTQLEKTRQDITDQIHNLSMDVKESVTNQAIKTRKLDVRKQNLIDHSNAIIQGHLSDETFVKTAALEKGKTILNEQSLLILLGKGGSGKTQIALNLASVYKDKGYIPFFFLDKDVIKYRDLISLAEKCIVIVEDLFGRRNVDFHEGSHKNILDILSNCLKTSTLLKMVFTIRNDPKCSENILAKHDIFDKKCIVNLDYKYRLTDKERITMILSHMRYNSIIPCKSPVKVDIYFDDDPYPRCSSECTADVIALSDNNTQICTNTVYQCCMCDTYLGFPETCRMFCSDKSLTILGVAYFRTTNKSLINKVTDLFTEGFDKLSCRYQYCVLVYTALKCNFFDNNILGSHIENDELFQRIFSIFDDKKSKIRKTLVQQAILTLEGGYLIKSSKFGEFYQDWVTYPRGNAYTFKHQAVHDAVLVSFGNECPETLMKLDICDLGFILQYIRPSLKQHDFNSSVIHVDQKLLIDKLVYFLDDDLSFKINFSSEFQITGILNPWNPPLPGCADDEDSFQDQTQSDESKGNESSDDENSLFDSESEDSNPESDTNDTDDDGEPWFRSYPELIGEYIRKCIIEKKFITFVKLFLERLSTRVPSPEQMKAFLNGLTRSGTCLMNLTVNSDIIRDSTFKYGDVNVLCLMFRPKSSNIKHYSFYELDDIVLQDRLIAIIDEKQSYKIITEIGNFLYRIGIQDENPKFVQRYLDSIIDKYNKREHVYKVRYIIDGMTGKGSRTGVVSLFIKFMQKHLLTYGSIKAIIGLWESLYAATHNISQTDSNIQLMAVLENKFKHHILLGADTEHGGKYKLHTQEYGARLFDLGVKIQDNMLIEDLISKMVEIYEVFLGGRLTYYFESPNSFHFLVYFYNGFTKFDSRKEDATQMCPFGMKKLHRHLKRYKIFLKKVREAISHANQPEEDVANIEFLCILRNMSIHNPNNSIDEDDGEDDGDQ
ncbi:uncharacterized protein LOC134684263 [Mytilus trossulus]|uniref:uncharacterized protein LOC134684263 n=1 Tax=Mytilus trossulus TaxID=6551 RepID=UPI0030045044